ncbi:MAG: hypothetical protein WCR42_16300 [bacterium]
MKYYNKILVARYNPENKCYVSDDTVLYIKPLFFKKLVSTKSQNFISSIDSNIKSRYGWVKDVESFSLEDYIHKYINKKDVSDEEFEVLKILLDSIQKYETGTPIAATYFQRGIEKQYMALSIHKVFFY